SRPRSRPLTKSEADEVKAVDVKARSPTGGGAPPRIQGSELVRIKGAKPCALPSFVEPQLASLADHPPLGATWVHEIKFDGYRLLARVDHGRGTRKTRSGLDWTAEVSLREEGAR